ncbi:hypothetical protein BKA70DRAFT_1287981 [Coprinopsis sp. MPI-PUGE-AT-0042]|nr:hypothetical protein BKA70DRAFT_1287981 [Coprinopsis sp. MPI-PUGE-AT-0042]
MFLTDSTKIKAVLLFPAMNRQENKHANSPVGPVLGPSGQGQRVRPEAVLCLTIGNIP